MFPESETPPPASVLSSPLVDPPIANIPAARPPISRGRAIAEVVLCSGYPTQLTIIAALAALGVRPPTDGTLSPGFVFAVSGIDTLLLLALVFRFLTMSDDRPRDVFLGMRPIGRELALGVAMVFPLFLMVVAVQVLVRLAAPSLHNVPVNPFASLLGSPLMLAGFIALVLVAGGLREELQRAFLLHRFDQRLGGRWVGLVVTSVAFGIGHTLQGWDAALVTGMMGACWAAMYLSRRSVVATVTSHALFNVTQVLVGYSALVRA